MNNIDYTEYTILQMVHFLNIKNVFLEFLLGS